MIRTHTKGIHGTSIKGTKLLLKVIKAIIIIKIDIHSDIYKYIDRQRSMIPNDIYLYTRTYIFVYIYIYIYIHMHMHCGTHSPQRTHRYIHLCRLCLQICVYTRRGNFARKSKTGKSRHGSKQSWNWFEICMLTWEIILFIGSPKWRSSWAQRVRLFVDTRAFF